MANVPINSLTPETVLALNSRFELQRNAGQGGESRSATLDEMLLKSGPYIDERQSAVNLLDWADIDDSDGSYDVSASVQSWQDTARAAGRIAIAPARVLGLATGISIKAPTFGTGGRTGYGTGEATQFSTVFKNIGINNPATPLLLIDNTSDFYNRSMMKGFVVDGNYSAGVRQCLGLVANGDIGVGALEGFLFEDIFATRCFTGIKIFGWTGILKLCSTKDNRQFGLNLILANSTMVQGGWYNAGVQGAWACRVQAANPGTGGEGTNGIKFVGATFQSGLHDSNGLDICEQVSSVSLDTCYFEKHSGSAAAGDHTGDEFPTADTFHIRAGVRAKDGGVRTVDGLSPERACCDITIKNCVISLGSGDSTTFRGRRVYFGNVQGVRLESQMQNGRLQFSADCKDITGAVTTVPDSTLQGDGTYTVAHVPGSTTFDESHAQGRPARSFIPNPNNHGAASGKVRGYMESYTHTRCTVANETGITRDGIQSLKVTRLGIAGGNQTHGWYAKPYGQHVLGLASKTVVLTGWIYLPNVGHYAANTGGPALGFYSNGNIYAYTYGPWAAPYVGTQKWWRFCVWHKMPVTQGYIGPYIGPLDWSADPGTTEHSVYISDLALFINPPSYTDVLAGRYSIAGEAGAIRGTKFFAEAAAAPTSGDIYSMVGDEIKNNAPTPGGNMGWVCTTAGAPGTWKKFGVIEA